LRILTLTTLYPNSCQPGHGIFVKTRLMQLLAAGGIESRVVAPVPWFPFGSSRLGRYSLYARVPSHERLDGIEVHHPRFPVIPKFGMTVAPWIVTRFVSSTIRRLLAEGFDFDLIDAHYFYPDGVAAVMLGRAYRKPVVVTARGSDINLISEYVLPRLMMKWAANDSAHMISVSKALKDKMVKLGMSENKITVLRNGVDLNGFHPPTDRPVLRQRLQLADGRTLLSVGNLIPSKGHDLVIRAMKRLPDFNLLIIGEGPEKDALTRLAVVNGVAGRVRFLGFLAHKELVPIYGAADALVLASLREGWPNVLLESMACGTPVAATRTGGVPEIVASSQAGVIFSERSVTGIEMAIRDLFADYPDRADTRLYAEGFSWEATTAGQLRLFDKICGFHNAYEHQTM
jgi:teichuronic acid biosynthesis glycosyltransferase TuaC